jgi:hypothetical protein
MTATVINATVNGYEVTGGNTAELVLQVGGQTAITIDANAEWVLGNVLPAESGGTGLNSAGTSGNVLTSNGTAWVSQAIPPSDNASNITKGILAVSYGGTGSNSLSFSGANVTDLNASNISSGTVGTARLGSGTANSTTFLRGDQTWATVSGGVTSLNGQTGAITNTGYGVIGSYVIAAENSYSALTERTPDVTVSGSNLVRSTFTPSGPNPVGINCDLFVGVNSGSATSLSLSGTWRRMTRSVNGTAGTTSGANLYVRIS